ncbi:uncharacterized protein LOC111052583 [Nilaparvata lugens]|uniref:uncharacterized protein LOC111052583 n=1 Tax=Nilaparvata lugens TaxID=108931 RepID=UPI00193CF426|nr:uncharacterized protein LOC111052583 [Nilaparvata lugens]
MHISTICLLTIFLHSIASGAIPESKSWNEFEAMMKGGGTYCLIVVYNYNMDENLKAIEPVCENYPSVKCYYGIQGASKSNQPHTSFDNHFKNPATPAFFFFKNGQQVKVIAHSSTGISMVDVDAAFKSL